MDEQREFQDFIDHLTDNAKHSLQHAEGIARSFGSAYIGTEHLLLGVLAQTSSIGAKVLESVGLTLDRAKIALDLTPKSTIIQVGNRGLSETAKLTLKMSWEVAQEFNQDYCGTEHILYSILNQKNARATVLLRDLSIDVDTLVAELEQYLNRQQYDANDSNVRAKRRRRGAGSALDFFGTDLTARAKAGELDPVIGREDQIKRMVTILGRRTKNNPVLIGEPGVGKTAIVEGLAQRIVDEEVPEVLLDRRIVMLDLAAMIAGTKYRGEFEERLKKVLEELTDDTKTIVFIDEMHLLVGAGAAEGAMDAGNMLKPALARGAIRMIGATTMDEYTKYIEKDAALERRFQPVIVPESTVPETIAILRGLKKHYEDFHGVQISDEVVKDAVHLAKRYIADRYMPDKAIDLIDEAASHARIERKKTPIEARKLQRELRVVTTRMDEAVDQEDYERAARYKTRMSQINKRLSEITSSQEKNLQVTLTSDDIANVVKTMTGVPLTKLKKSESSWLLDLDKYLKKHIIGQDEAVEAVVKAIRRNRSGISAEGKPIGSFVFLGPTGVGKTELARVLAREYFDSEDALIKIDMSELSERHTVARLVGAPAGYVGYEEGGQLTDKIRRQPYSLVLFDEIEKAHPEVFNILLQILEDGYLSDAKGRRVDFSNTIIIMTSNVGADKLQKEVSLGFRATSSKDHSTLDTLHDEASMAVQEDLKRLMRPELLNRIDRVIHFRALTRNDVQKILELQLKDLRKRISSRGFALKVQPAAKNLLLDKGFDPHNGARPMRRALQDQIEDELAQQIIAGNIGKGQIFTVSARKGSMTFSVDSE